MQKLIRNILLFAIVLLSAFKVSGQIAMPDNVCIGAYKHYWIDSTSNAGNTITWKIDGTVQQSGAVNLFSHTWGASGTYIIAVQELSTDGCPGPVRSGPVYVVPLPTAVLSGGGTICEGGTANLHVEFTGTPPWNFTYSNGFTNATISNINSTPYTFGVQPTAGTNTYTPTALSDAYCTATPADLSGSANVMVHPAPVVDFTATTACLGDTTYFTATGNNLSTVPNWVWDFGDGSFGTFNTPGNTSHVFATYGNFTVTLTVSDSIGCSYTVSHDVEVRPLPLAFFNNTTSVCDGSPVSFMDLSTNPSGQGYIQQWEWDFGDGSPHQVVVFPASPNVTHVYPAPGTYNAILKVTSSLGCVSTYTNPVAVINKPIAAFTFTSNCVNQTTQFTNTSLNNGVVPINWWYWDFGDAISGVDNTSSLENPQHIYATAGTYTVMQIVANVGGCPDTSYQQVTVKPSPPVDFGSSPGCVNAPTLFWADTTVIDVTTTATYNWNFGDGGTSYNRNTQHTYLAPGSYNVTLTVQDTSGCLGSLSHVVEITVPPLAHFTANANNCVGQSVQFTNLSTSTDGYIVSWLWNFGDGNTQLVNFPATPSVNHTYINTGIFAVTLTVTNNFGCTSTETNIIQVTGSPTADFMYSGHCEENEVAFTDVSAVPATTSISAWAWNFGDPTSGISNTSNSQNATHTFAIAGNYFVRFVVWSNNGCTDTITKEIIIKAKPAVGFTAQGSCEDTPITFVPGSVIVQNAIATWLWQFGDGNSSSQISPSYTYTSAGNYTATLTITDTAGCSNTISQSITIAAAPLANFSFTVPGCNQTTIIFNDLTSVPAGFITKWIWNFGDGNSQTFVFPNAGPVTHTYTNAGNFNVSLTVKTSDSCSSFVSKLMVLSAKPSAAFSYTGNCQDAGVSFIDQSGSNGAGISVRNWNFGDPASGTSNNSNLVNPTHIYTLAGTYTVQLIVTTAAGCSDTVTQSINIVSPPTVSFTSVAGCNDDTTQFNSSALVNMATTASWLWQFGDGVTSTLPDPVHIYASSGTYTVSLTIVDTAGCSATISAPIIVTPGPVAAFAASSPSCAGTAILFTDLSSYPTGSITLWHWTFGDGHDTTYTVATSTISHNYSQPGNFSVTLTVNSQNGCQNTYQQTISISASPVAGFAWLNTCEGLPTQFSDQSVASSGVPITVRNWNFGDPTTGTANTSVLTNPVHTFSAAGTYQVTLIATNALGCTDTIQHQLIIIPKPGVDFYHDTIRCVGTPLAFFTDTIATLIPQMQSFTWNFGDGTANSTLQNPVHSFANVGTYTATLTVVNISGCSNSISHEVTIGGLPVTSFSYANACQGSPTQFTDLSYSPTNGTIVSWYWDFGVNGLTTDTSTLLNPSFAYTLPGTYTVSLTTVSETGCSSTKTQPVQVFNKPTAAFSYSASPCENGSVHFADSSYSYQSGIVSWNWEFEPFQYSTQQNPVYQYYAVDSCYDVRLIISDFRGCSDTVTRQICVPAPLDIAFTYQMDCFGNPTRFAPQLLTPSGDSLITFNWNFGDPQSGTANTSGIKKPAHTFTKPGFYTISLTAGDKFGCQATHFQSIEIKGLPLASFTYAAGQCDSTLILTSTSVDTSAIITTYIWNYGDGTIDTLNAPIITTTHKYLTEGTFTVKLTVINENGCIDEQIITYKLSPCLEAAFIYMDQTSGCQNAQLSFNDKSVCQGTISSWEWSWGDLTPSTVYTNFLQTVNHTYAQAGIYEVRLKVTTLISGINFVDSTSKIVTILASPVADFTAAGACVGSRVNFVNTTNPNGTAIVSYQWDFGDVAATNDTSELKNPYYTYSKAGDFETSLIVTNQLGCSDTLTQTVNVHGLPTAGFNFSVACLGHPTHFFDQSTPYIAPLTHLGWVVKDGSFTLGHLTGASAMFTFDSLGSYTILHAVSDSNNCTDTITRMITVVPAPFSVFNVNGNFENKQGQVQFENGSLGADEYYWDFGNGETSNLFSPVTIYNEDGDYLVQLYTRNNFDCVDSTAVVYKMMYKGLWMPNALAVGPVPSVRLWKPVGVNLALYNAEVFDRWGNRIWQSDKLTDKGAPAEGWDGSFKEMPCQEGNYTWKITAVFKDGSIWHNSDIGNHDGLNGGNVGNITLIR